jgi:DNA-binding MarR family transcriptional regulator
MLQSKANRKYQIIWLVRRLFRALAETADQYLKADELTAADRAVMEFLYPDEKLSVPAIANKYRTSRQHVQVTANALLKKGLLRSEANPRHKRSPLMRLSTHGREAFAEIRRHEEALVDKLFLELDQQDIESTRRLLQTLLARLESGEIQ